MYTSLPIIYPMGKWISGQASQVIPKSQIGKAISDSISRCEQLSVYLHDWILEMDNNLVENAICPVTLGRKIDLLAGSHKAAQRAGMIYSFFPFVKPTRSIPVSGSPMFWKIS